MINDVVRLPWPRKNVNTTHMNVVIARNGIRLPDWSDIAPNSGAVNRTTNIDNPLANPYCESEPPMSFTTHNAKCMDIILNENIVLARSYRAHESTDNLDALFLFSNIVFRLLF